jgi:hypothetical protein
LKNDHVTNPDMTAILHSWTISTQSCGCEDVPAMPLWCGEKRLSSTRRENLRQDDCALQQGGERMDDMTESVSSLENDARAIQALSEKLKVPELKVIEVYRTEFNRLAAQSRIETFLGVLAMRNTKSILRNTNATDKR